MSTGVLIATPDDARAIAEIHVASWQQGYRGQLRDGASVLLAEYADKALGFVSYGPSRDDDAPETGAEIYGLYVHPDAWSTGKGQRLHDGALVALGSSGWTVVTLWVLTCNDRARRFYSRHGWQLDGATKVIECDGVTLSEVRCKRELDPLPTPSAR